VNTRSVDLDGQLRVHPDIRFNAVLIGRERSPALVIDNFLADPDVLVTYAERCSFDAVSDTFYPGIRAAIPPIYSFAVRNFLGPAIGKAFGLDPARVTRELSHFSLVTTPPEKLSGPQRIPHLDNTNANQLAILHYLCGSDFGGTSFYRHKRTGFESIDETRSADFGRALKEDYDTFGPPPPRYICDEDPRYERIAAFPASLNRVLIYRSMNLHSADIPLGFNFDSNPRTGRLTANTFFFYR
jgi:uncharacterized protein DUF6445